MNVCDVAGTSKKLQERSQINENKPNTNENNAQKEQKEKNKYTKNNSNNNSSKKVVGSATETAFQSAPRKASFHVGRASLNTSVENISNHFSKKFNRNEFLVEKCPSREGAKSVSFKVESTFSLLEEMYKSENWPAGITVRKYRLFPEQINGEFDKDLARSKKNVKSNLCKHQRSAAQTGGGPADPATFTTIEKSQQLSIVILR
ncbi:unnamed protein product [Brassicogethes aeneus]|uniref:Uncharacterized protein n=1 Tax=Brassicogethes aeneus TaxID=1431903 RepID=A0A9P0BGM5_BRAAE|nr:unnamed protein product [Brassicogethes aeneus]